MRADVNIYPAQAESHYEGLLSAVGGRPVSAESWVSRRDARRQARASWRRVWGRRTATA
jgi:hypothetical protein